MALSRASVIGRLRHRIELYKPTQTVATTGRGVATTTFASQGKVWADVETINQAEDQQLRALVPTATHRVTIRAFAGIDQTWRIGWGETTLNVMSVIDEQNRERWQVLLCGEEVA